MAIGGTRSAQTRERLLTQNAHVDGWPPDWREQLAQVLDVPLVALDHFSVGGPLAIAEGMGTSVRALLPMFRQAFADRMNGDA